MRALHWEIFCRVIDNHGDLGVCWRLAADLASRGETVRLWVDDASALRWMAPAGSHGVTVVGWPDDAALPEAPALGDVVVEAFGCELPAALVSRMAYRQPVPVWVNLEYLSAEPYVERSHGLPSPVAAACGLGKWFFYPGFTPATGGLLREPGLLDRRAAFDRTAWLAAQGIAWHPGERLASLFGYSPPPLAPWLRAWSARPTLLLAAPGPLCEALRASVLPAGLRVVELPWLTQTEYDHLLWSCDFNLVRGEDSLVRAIWAGSPFLWQIYPQLDGVHATKLDALLDRLLGGVPAPVAEPVRLAMRQWNSLAAGPLNWPDEAPWGQRCRQWRRELVSTPDLTSQLMTFCRTRAARIAGFA